MLTVCAFACVTLNADIASLLADNSLRGAKVGLVIERLGGPEIVSKSAEVPLIPASVMKIVTASCAFEFLGPEFTPLTAAWRTGNKVYVRGGGDPTLRAEDCEKMAKAIGAREGDVVQFDDSLFGTEWKAPTWTSSETAYCPPVGALCADRGELEVWAQRGKAWTKPQGFGIKLVGGLQEGAGKPTVRWEKFGSSIRVSGSYSSSTPKMIGSFTVPDPGTAAARIFGDSPTRAAGLKPQVSILLPAEGKSFATYREGDTSVAVLRGPPIWKITKTALTESDNFLAETLLKLCGAESGTSGLWIDSLALASKHLASLGVAPDQFALYDGSGLSKLDRLSPRAVVSVLGQNCQRERGTMFLNCLAKPGEGTLRNRLKGLKVWAKTGSLSGVTALAGVIEPAANQRYLFCIIVNGGQGPAEKQRSVLDSIVRLIGRG